MNFEYGGRANDIDCACRTLLFLLFQRMKLAFWAVGILSLATVINIANAVIGPEQIDPRVELIPEDVRAAVYKAEPTYYVPYPKVYTPELLGPMELKIGEAVRCTYTWKLSATSEVDPQKWLPPDITMGSTFLYSGGDPMRAARVALAGTTDTLIIAKPVNPNAADVPLIGLATLKTVVGLPKMVLLNRMKPPSTIEAKADGSEVWSYRYQISESTRALTSSFSTTSGTVGGVPFDATTSTAIPVTMSRTIVVWDFKLTINSEGRVQNFAKGTPGAGAWTRTAP